MAKTKNLMAKTVAKFTGTSVARPSISIGGVDITDIKVIRKVTYPTLSHTRDGQSIAFKVESAYAESKKDIAQPDGTKNGKRAIIVIVTDLTDGIEKQYVVPSILQNIWDTDFEGDTYVGKSFAVQKLAKRDGKRYRDLNIVEIDGDDFVAKVQAAQAAA